MDETVFLSRDGLDYIVNGTESSGKISDTEFLNKDGLKVVCNKIKDPSADISSMDVDDSSIFLSKEGLLYLHCISKS